MIGILARVFGCSHKKTTFPIRRSGAPAHAPDAASVAYVVCLECGAEFDYNWQTMKIGSSAVTRPFAELVTWDRPKGAPDFAAAKYQSSSALPN